MTSQAVNQERIDGADDVLQRLSDTLLARKNSAQESSYTAQLLASGPNSILKKIGEEATELVIAGKNGDKKELIWESTDLIYHIMVLLTYYDLRIDDVIEEVRRRQGVSGLEEKRARPPRSV